MFLNKFFGQSNKDIQVTASRAVGIDFGSSSIKVVELEDRGGVLTLTTYGELHTGPYDERAVGEIIVLDSKKERQAVIDLLRESAVKAKDTVYCIPLSGSFITVFNLETDAKNEDVSSRIRVEARKYIPIPIANVVLDWVVIESIKIDDVIKHTILLVAIQSEIVKRITALRSSTGLGFEPNEIECFSTIRSVYVPPHNEAEQIILDFGAGTTKIYILREGMLVRMHRVRGGSASCTEEYASKNSISFEEAESIKVSLTLNEKNFIEYQKIYHNTFSRVLSEVTQVIKSYEKDTDITIEHVTLTGGGALFPGFDSYVANTLQRQARLAQPFESVAYPAFMEDTLRAIGPSYSTALGAALRFF